MSGLCSNFSPLFFWELLKNFPDYSQYYSRHSLMYSLMFTTYSLIMAQVEFSIVGKNVVESELNYNFLFNFWHITNAFLQNGGNSIFFAYYSRIILDSYTHRLFSKLFRHNPRIPSSASATPLWPACNYITWDVVQLIRAHAAVFSEKILQLKLH